jgi:hypothetical protein
VPSPRRLPGTERLGGKKRYGQHQHIRVEGVVECDRPHPRFHFSGQITERVGTTGVGDECRPAMPGEAAGERGPDVAGTNNRDVCAHDQSLFPIPEVWTCLVRTRDQRRRERLPDPPRSGDVIGRTWGGFQ